MSEKSVKHMLIAIGILMSLSSALSSNQALAQSNKPAGLSGLEAFLDDFISNKMEEYHIPGMVFLLVKDGKIVVRKGYGYADLEKKIPVTPDETVFQVGSVSKLFTATAAMQLVEQGQIDLEADVNSYLKPLRLEENYPEPVTLANLLTHSAGFRAMSIGSMTRKESNRIPLGEFLAAKTPRRALPPGRFVNYSNQGFYIAGYLVEVVSGIPFAQYVADHILHPLGMERSSFLVPPELSPNLANGYSFENGNWHVVPAEYSILISSPAGSLISTADDMARFMIAHLQGGRYEDRRILKESTCVEMQKQQFTNDPRLPGTCYGFYEYRGYNQRAILHDGDVPGFSSRLFLLPDQNIGVFVCNNSGHSAVRMQLTDALMSRFYPLPEQSVPSKAATDIKKSTDRRLAGTYRPLALGLDYIDKFEAMWAALNLSEGRIRAWIELEPLLLQVPGGTTRFLFRENSRGDIAHLFIDAQQMPLSYERAPWYDTKTYFWISYAFIVFVFLSASPVWLVGKRIRRYRKQPAENSLGARRAIVLALLTAVLNLFFAVCFAVSLFLLKDEVVYGVPFVVKALLIIPIVTTVLTAGLVVSAVLAWRHKYWNTAGRLHYSLIVLTCVGFVLWLYQWNWLGFQY